MKAPLWFVICDWPGKLFGISVATEVVIVGVRRSNGIRENELRLLPTAEETKASVAAEYDEYPDAN